MGKLKQAGQAAQAARSHSHCLLVRQVEEIWKDLDKEDRAWLSEAFSPDSTVSAGSLLAALNAGGIRNGRVASIGEHRGGRCICKEKAPWEK